MVAHPRRTPKQNGHVNAQSRIVSLLASHSSLTRKLNGVAGLFLRRPSRRQARIRSIVASRLGPFSDPADWAGQLVARVTPAFGIAVSMSEGLLRKAEELVKVGHYEDALLVARMALFLLDRRLAERAEDITEECLRLSAEED